MSFTNNASNLTGKSTTNAFNVIADSLTVNKNTLCKGDLTVLGTTNIGTVSLENGYVNNLTVNNFTATNPVPISSGGTGLATIGAPNQVLTVNPGGTALIYAPPGLINPAVITGTGFTGNPTLTLGLEADTGSLGRGFIRTGIAAVSGLCLGTSSATVLRLWSNFSTDSNAEIINTNANFTYNSTGSSGVFQVLNGGGGISFTNSGIGTISMATSAGTISMSAGAGAISLTTGIGATSITTGAGPINLTTGTGNISLTTAAAGIISITTAIAGAVNVGAVGLGAVNVFGSAITLAAPVIYIGTAISPPIPSILNFACGAINGFTGAWDLTTLGFQLNAVSISLNSSLTIALNNNTTVSGSLSSLTSSVFTVTNSQAVPLFTVAALAPNLSVGNTIFSGIGSSLSAGNSGFISFTRDTISYTSWSTYSSTTSIKQEYNGKITLTAPTTDVNGILNVINGNIFTNQNIIGGISIINNGDLALSASSPGYILIRGGSGSIITLPDATTLIVGYTYTINNNTNNATTVNRHVSGLVGIVPALSAATVICIGTSSANGQWDIHITGPSTGTDWATPGQIGSAIPNTGAFTTLSANGQIFGNSNNLLSTTVVNPGITIWNNAPGNQYGMDLGYNATSARFRTRIFAATSGDISLATGTGANQSDFTDRFIVRGDTGNIELLSKTTFTGSESSLTSSLYTFNNTNTNPQFTGAFLAPNMANNNTSYLGIGKAFSGNDSAFLTFKSVTSPSLASTSTWSLYGSTTSIEQTMSGSITSTTNSSSINSSKFNVVNTNTNPQMSATILAPNMLNNNNIFLAVGKSLSTTNCTFIQYNPLSVLSYARWSIFDSSTSIEQIYNGKITLNGNTDINGTLAASNLKSSSTIYGYSSETQASINQFTNVNFITVFRQIGTGLNWIDQSTGFRNDTGLNLLVTVSFSCKRSTNAFGITAIRILGGAGEGLGVQDVSGEDAVSISGNTFLTPGQTVRCQIYQNIQSPTVPYKDIFVSINTTAVIT